MRKPRNYWTRMSNKEFIEHGRRMGLVGVTSSEAYEKNRYYYYAARKKGLFRKIFKMVKRNHREWISMSDDVLLRYAEENNLVGLNPTSILRNDSAYYKTISSRGLLERVAVRKARDWKSMSDEELVDYSKRHGLFGSLRIESWKRDKSFYRTVLDRDLVDIIFAPKQKRRWENKKNSQLVQYAIEHDFYGLSPSEAQIKDPGFYVVIRKRGLIDTVFRRKYAKRIYWSGMSDKQIIQYSRDHGIYGLNPSEAWLKHNSFYEVARERGLIDEIFRRKRITKKAIINFLSEDRNANYIFSLASLNGYSPEVAQILVQEWPERFPPYNELVKEIPKLVQGIGGVLGQLEYLESSQLDSILDSDIKPETKGNITALLFTIGVEEYQTKFNQNPTKTLQELKLKSRKAKNKEVRRLFNRMHGYYNGAYNFHIPGYGSLSDLT